jgi:hypothetical protein
MRLSVLLDTDRQPQQKTQEGIMTIEKMLQGLHAMAQHTADESSINKNRLKPKIK